MLLRFKKEKSELDCFVERLGKADIHVVLFEEGQIKKHFQSDLAEALRALDVFLRGVGFNAFSITLEEEKEMTWYSTDSGRVVINLALFDPRNQEHRVIVQKTAQRAHEIELTLKDLNLD